MCKCCGNTISKLWYACFNNYQAVNNEPPLDDNDSVDLVIVTDNNVTNDPRDEPDNSSEEFESYHRVSIPASIYEDEPVYLSVWDWIGY
jgi:hypothetical protein